MAHPANVIQPKLAYILFYLRSNQPNPLAGYFSRRLHVPQPIRPTPSAIPPSWLGQINTLMVM